tara:strand:+ start:1052 stop:2110 length:1059 start_codon:yes stop_codon:yes gene_type:complete
MTQLTATVPPMECPDVMLPTPANLANLFGNLITQAERAAISEIEELQEEAQKLKDIVQKIRDTVLSPYDPKFKRLEIPEKEYEIMITRLINEYSTYVQAKIMDIIANLLPSLGVEVEILGVTVDAVKFATDRPYRAEILGQIDVDSMYDLLPPEYQSFKDKFDSADLRGKKINDFIEKKVKEFLQGNIIQGLKDLGLSFTLPTDPRAAVQLAIQEIKADAKKDMNEKIEEIKSIKVGPFSVEQILGGEFKDNVEITEFTFDRLIDKLLVFAEDYFAYLFKEMLSKITDAIKAIPGLKDIIEFLTFTFCDFLTLLGFPKTIDLSGFSGIQTVANVQIPLVSNINIVEDEESSG